MDLLSFCKWTRKHAASVFHSVCEREEHLSTVDLTAVSVCRHIFFLNLHLHTIESVAPYTCIFYFSVHYFIFVRAQNKCLCPAADGRESEHVKVNCS